MRRGALLLGSAAMIMFWPAAAQPPAPSADPAATSAPASTLAASPAPVTPTEASTQAGAGDIIVTARKRQESILNVPVIETAIPQARLDRLQVTDLAAVETLVPGLSLGTTVLTNGTQVSLRGIGTTSLDAGIDQSVSLNLDGLQLSQGLAYSAGVFDLAQVEVLKGPQALFYGKNSPGGVISLRTADPGDRPEVIARYGHEFYANENRGELIVSGPVTPTLGLRLAGLYDHNDGFFRNEAVALPGTGAKDPRYPTDFPTTSYIVRGTAVWKPDPAFDARLKVNVTRDKVEGGPEQQLRSCPDGTAAVPGTGIPFIGGGEDCHLDQVIRIVDMDPAAFPGVRNGGTPFTDIRQQFGTLELNYRPLPGITATSTTGYYHILTDGLINGAESGYAGTTLTADNHYRRHDVTEEVRVNSDFQSPVNFTAGGFYQSASVFNRILVGGNTAYGLPPILVAGTHDISIDSKSVFGQLRWKIVPQVELAGGLRYTHETRTDTPTGLNQATGDYVPTPIPIPRLRSNNVSPEITVTYKPTEDVTLFASYKKGFKSGSFSITTPAIAGINNSFGDERIRGAEGGVKARLLDRQLILNLAGYRYNLQGLQVGSDQPQNGIPVLHTVNAGSAQVYGVDFDGDFRPRAIPALDLHVGGEWNHARFGVLDNAACYGGQTIAMGCSNSLDPATGLFTAQNLNGAPLVRAPLWQVNFGFSYAMPVGRDMRLVLDSSSQYSSRYLAQLGDRPDFFQGAFLKTDASLTLEGPHDRWEFAVIGRNLSNKITTGVCTNLNAANGSIFGGQITGGTGRGPAGIDETACSADRGREVWLRLTLRPFG